MGPRWHRLRALDARAGEWLNLPRTRRSLVVAATLATSAVMAMAGVPEFEREAAASTSTAKPARFVGSSEPGRAGVEASARALVAHLGGLAVEDPPLAGWLVDPAASTTSTCPPSRLQVGWSRPAERHRIGAHVEPLGPPPTDTTTRVNGVVTCIGSTYEYLGFEAERADGRWMLSAVPVITEGTQTAVLPGEAEAHGLTAPAAGTGGEATGLPDPGVWSGLALEPLASYEPQTTCDPAAKPGVLGFRDLLLNTFPGTRNYGIGRACELPGLSEHKEGRGFDWGVEADDPAERLAVETMIGWLFAPDSNGEPYAMARRLGVMYVIWDNHIWASYLADQGWRPYVGDSDHTDHVHLSFNWAGALGRSSFWHSDQASRLGGNAPDLPLWRPAPPAPVPALLGPTALPAIPAPPGAIGSGTAAPTSEEPVGAATSPPPSTTTTSSTTTSTTSTTTTSTTTTTTMPPPPTLPPTTLPLTGGSLSSL